MSVLKLTMPKIEDVPEALREFYEEKDGAVVMSLDPVTLNSHPSVKGLADALDRNKKENKRLNTLVTELQGREIPDGFTIEEWDRLKEFEATNKDDKDPDKNKKRDELLASRDKLHEQKIDRLTKKHAEDRAKDAETIKGLETFVTREISDNRLTKALLESGFAKAHLPVLKSHFRSNIVVKKNDDGEYGVVIKAGDDEEVDVLKYIQDCAGAEDYRFYLEPAKGSGARGAGENIRSEGVTTNPWEKGKENLTLQAQIFKTDRPKAERLAKLAGVPLLPGHAA